MFNNLKFYGGFAVAGIIIVSAIEIYVESKRAYELHKIESEKRMKAEKELKEKIENDIKTNINKFKRKYNFEEIVEVTLNNTDLKEEDRAYIYDKLYKQFSPIYYTRDYSISESGLNQLIYDIAKFEEKYTLLKGKNKDAINGYILNSRKEDERLAKHVESQRKKRAEQEKIDNELKIINAKKESELAILKAKLDLEDSKFKTVMKTMTSVGEKNSSINLKTNVNLSGDEN